MTYTFTAGGTITQGAVVKLTGDFTVEVATAGTDKVVGVALQGADTGENLPVELNGALLRAYAGGVITAGDPLNPTTAGDVIKEVTASTDYMFIALEGAAASGDEVRILTQRGTTA